MIEDYPEANADETLAKARRLDDEQLADFVEYEREHKNRTTVIEPLERELVEVIPAGSQYAGGIWFDDVDESKTVRRSRRVETAIAAGALEVIE